MTTSYRVPRLRSTHSLRQRLRLDAALWFALAVLVTTASACDRPNEERCQELDAIIYAKVATLPRECATNLDCFVTEITPGYFVAVSERPEDPELDAAIADYVDSCDPGFDQDDVFEARCHSYSASQEPNTVPVNLCSLVLDGQIVTPDVVGPDNTIEVCDCGEHADCASTHLCRNQCTCQPACEAACTQAESCGEGTVAALNMGSDVDTCIAVCEANLTDTVLQQQVECMATAACSVLPGCLF